MAKRIVSPVRSLLRIGRRSLSVAADETGIHSIRPLASSNFEAIARYATISSRSILDSLAVLTPIFLSLFRFFFFHPFFSRGEIEVSLSLSLPFFSSVVRCLADGTRCLVLLWTFQDSVGVEEFPVSNGRFLGRIIVPYENLEILQIRYFK